MTAPITNQLQKACVYSFACLAISICGGKAASGAEVVFWQDPVVTHTNGVRLASSTPLRSHNLYWQCDSEHRGYCNGRVISPCRDDLVATGERLGRGYCLPYGPTPRAVGNRSMVYGAESYGNGFETIETATVERLGSIPNSDLLNADR